MIEGIIDGYLWVVWLAVSVVLAWWTLVLCFYAVMYAKTLVEKGVRFHWFFLVPIYVGFVIGVLLDIVFNFTWGTIAFRERPREWVFTARCKRHKEKGASDWRGIKAMWWCDEMNKIEVGHC